MLSILAKNALAQAPGSLKNENHPSLTVSACSGTGKHASCTTEQKPVVIDSNWRWLHENGVAKNCYTGNEWDKTLCPDAATCTKNCVIEGADAEYASTYGITAQGNELKLDFVTSGPSSKNVGSRTYLMEDESTYKMFKLKNREFTFDVDVSQLPCGLNGALYFVQMDADGGMSRFPTNTAGAKYGTGYCDAQCPHDLKYINGQTNNVDWVPSPTDKNSGTGKYGTCCVEMDIWEANTISTAFTPHACSVKEQTQCSGVDCGDNDSGDRFKGVCDKNGCDFQTFRLGNETFYGKGKGFTIDTTKKITVVTQFLTADDTDTGALTEIKRHYVQDGKIFDTPSIKVGKHHYSSVSDKYCKAEVGEFKDNTNFLEKGGMSSMDSAFEKGMVLVMSLWDDHSVNMLWLDSTYPTSGDKPGDKRGTCATTSGKPDDVETNSPNANVKYSNIKFGPIGSTSAPAKPAAPSMSMVASVVEQQSGATSAATCPTKPWSSCTGTCCPLGWECVTRTEAFHQCVPSSALQDSFLKTLPTAASLDAFIKTGTTLFPASGLPAAKAAAPVLVAA